MEPTKTSLLPSPNELAEKLPLSRTAAARTERARKEVTDIVAGRDERFLLIVGPCSIHDEDAALEYAERLARLQARVSNEVLLCMRVYLEKPRTTVGWKGFLHDPELDGSCNTVDGLFRARRLMTSIAETGLGMATELLDPILAEYQLPLLSWAAIGARTCDSQIHRELASRAPCAVGFKNATSGSVEGAVRSVAAASHAHTAMSIDGNGRARVVTSDGNPHCHLVLRGGETGPNYDARDVTGALSALDAQGLPRRVLVDCSHGNSGKDPERQAEVLRDVVEQRRGGNRAVIGGMVESHLVAGQQKLGPRSELRRGQSITDGCIGFEQTEALVERIAHAGRPQCYSRIEFAQVASSA